MPSNRLLVVTYIYFLIVDTFGYIPKPLRFFFFFLRCIARMKASSSASTAGPSGVNRFMPPEWFSYSPPENDAVKRRAKEEQIPYL
nr:MAG TPA: hypothetical protein [Caudoviricetes sp.]